MTRDEFAAGTGIYSSPRPEHCNPSSRLSSWFFLGSKADDMWSWPIIPI